MATCEICKSQLLEYLYGLLDEPETRDLRSHVEACAACQAALKEAEQQQRLFARAARVAIGVPEFAAPDFDDVLPTPAQETVAAQPVSVPVAAPASRKRSRLLLYVSWTVAVALMLVAGWGYVLFSHGLVERETLVALARKELDNTEHALAAVNVDYERRQDRVATELKQKEVQVQVSGPAQVHGAAPAPMHVKTLDMDGKPRKALVTVELVDAQKKAVLRQEHVSTGALDFELPAGLAEKKLELVVQARADEAETQVTQPLAPPQHAYLTHVALNKATYYIGEVLFFRTLTLENFSLKPAPAGIPLRYALVDLKGKVIKELEGSVGPGGIAGGEFALTNDIDSGVYRIEINARADAGAGAKILPQSRRVEIVREVTPQIETDKAQYLPGQNINLSLKPRSQQNQKAFANKAITVQPLNADSMPGAAAQQLRTDAKGSFNYQLSEKLDSNRAVLEIQVENGKRKEKLVQAIPVVPSQVTVEFFPEGGDLVEGLPTRVYYRVLSPKGEPVEQPGRVIVLSSTEVIHDSEPSQGAGVFTLTPRRGEVYSVRVTSPKTEIAAPFDKLGIKDEGVVLGVPTGVAREGEAIEVVLGNKGKPRSLLVLATCRGQIVGQQSVTVSEGQTKLKIAPVAGAAGVLRITVLESTEQRLVPLAERLVYRVPERRLHVVAVPKGGPVVRGGQSVQLGIQGQNEKMQQASFWNLVAVVDEKHRPEKECGLPDFFYLANDLVQPESLEHTPLVVGDAPEHWQALDLFLGTHGWRRFVPLSSQMMVARAGEGAAKQRGGVHAGQLGFFYQQNASAAELQQQYQAELAKTLTELRAEILALRDDLMRQKSRQEQEYRMAAAELADFRALPALVLRAAGGVLVLLGLVGGCVLLVVGMIRLARKLDSTWAFAGALVTVGLCLAFYVGFKPADVDVAPRHAAVELAEASKILPPLPQPRLQANWQAPAPATEVAKGQFALAGTPKDVTQRERAVSLDDLAPVAKKAPALALLSPPASATLGGAGFAEKETRHENKSDLQGELKDRFLQAKNAQEQKRDARKEPGDGGNVPGAAPPPSPAKQESPQPLPAPKMVQAAKAGPGGPVQDGLARQYAFRRGKEDATWRDTLLWHPALFVEHGAAALSFDVGTQPATYRVLILSNSPDGRLGFHESTLHVQP